MDKSELKKKVLAFMRAQRIAAVATMGDKGEPQVATVICLTDDSFNVYFATRKDSRKFANLEKNKDVGLVLGTNADAPITVQIQGRAEILENPKDAIIQYFDKHITLMSGFTMPEWFPLKKLSTADFVVIQVRPTWLRWMNLDTNSGSYNEEFYQIIP